MGKPSSSNRTWSTATLPLGGVVGAGSKSSGLRHTYPHGIRNRPFLCHPLPSRCPLELRPILVVGEHVLHPCNEEASKQMLSYNSLEGRWPSLWCRLSKTGSSWNRLGTPHGSSDDILQAHGRKPKSDLANKAAASTLRQKHLCGAASNTQTPGRIQKVDPPILGSNTLLM